MFKSIVKIPIRFYRYAISPLLPPTCRFVPSCSEYALEAIEKHGAMKGGWLACKRICTCHPFSRKRGYDPVPERQRGCGCDGISKQE